MEIDELREWLVSRSTVHNVTDCPSPKCSGKLGSDKDAYTDPVTGKRLRKRQCPKCGLIVYTQQPAEEVTGMEMPSGAKESQSFLCKKSAFPRICGDLSCSE